MEPFSPIIEEHREELIALRREFGVARLEVFGSVMTPEFALERSDLDVLVTYPPDYDSGPWLGRFQELEERLAALLGRDIDLVIAKPFRNPYFAEAVEETRTLLYAAYVQAAPVGYGRRGRVPHRMCR